MVELVQTRVPGGGELASWRVGASHDVTLATQTRRVVMVDRLLRNKWWGYPPPVYVWVGQRIKPYFDVRRRPILWLHAVQAVMTTCPGGIDAGV